LTTARRFGRLIAPKRAKLESPVVAHRLTARAPFQGKAAKPAAARVASLVRPAAMAAKAAKYRAVA
jgi:hypothetical protein